MNKRNINVWISVYKVTYKIFLSIKRINFDLSFMTNILCLFSNSCPGQLRVIASVDTPISTRRKILDRRWIGTLRSPQSGSTLVVDKWWEWADWNRFCGSDCRRIVIREHLTDVIYCRCRNRCCVGSTSGCVRAEVEHLLSCELGRCKFCETH